MASVRIDVNLDDVDALLALHDETFVRAAYRCVLGRPADGEGARFYVARLRSGVAKEQLLAELANSQEATRGGVAPLPGLASLRARHAVVQPGLAQRVVKRLVAPALDPILARIRVVENAVGRLIDDTSAVELARRTADKIDLMADRIRGVAAEAHGDQDPATRRAGPMTDLRSVTEMRRFLDRHQ